MAQAIGRGCGGGSPIVGQAPVRPSFRIDPPSQEELDRRTIERAERLARMEREYLAEQAEAAKVEAYYKAAAELKAADSKAVGKILTGNGMIYRTNFNGQEVYFALRHWEARYPEPAGYRIGPHVRGQSALKCLLSRASREELKLRWPDEDVVAVKSIRIIGFSESGKSAHCVVEEW